MCEFLPYELDDEETQQRKVLLAALVLGGAALITAGALCWWSKPQNKANRLLGKAQKTIDEIEGALEKLE